MFKLRCLMYVMLTGEKAERTLEKAELDFLEKHATECAECANRRVEPTKIESTNFDPRAQQTERMLARAILDHLGPRTRQ